MILVDLDGTLAFHYPGDGIDKIGEPIPIMQERVKKWISEGKDVRIFTARMSIKNPIWVEKAIKEWTLKHLGKELPCTCSKDFETLEIWDDRAVGVVPNEGTTHLELIERLEAKYEQRRK